MVKKKRVSGGWTSKRERTKKDRTRLWVYLVVAIMVLSGLMYFGLNAVTTPREGQDNQGLEAKIIRYNVVESYERPTVDVVRETNDFIVIPNNPQAINQELLVDMLGWSVEGVSDVQFELSDSFMFFRITEDVVTPGVEDKIRGKISPLLGGYTLLREYECRLDVGLGGESIYVIGQLNLTAGDRISIMVFQKIVGGIQQGEIGFMKGRVESPVAFTTQPAAEFVEGLGSM